MGQGLGVVAAGGHVSKVACGGGAAEAKGAVEHQDIVAAGEGGGGAEGGAVARTGGNAVGGQEFHGSSRPTVIAAHVAEAGGGGGRDHHLNGAGILDAVGIGTHIGDGYNAAVTRLGQEGDLAQQVDAAHGVVHGGNHLAAVLGGSVEVVVELPAGGVGGGEPDGGQGLAAPGRAGGGKVGGVEVHGQAGGGVGDDGGLTQRHIGQLDPAVEGLAVGGLPLKGDAHGAASAAAGDKGNLVQPGRGGAVITAGAHLRLAGLAVLVVQIAAAAGVVIKDHIVQIGAGLLHAGLVERVRLEVDGGTVAGLELHGNVGAAAIAHPNDQLAGELVAVVRPALKGDGDRPFKIALGYEGQVVDLVPVELLVLLYFAFTGVAIVVVEGALAGGGQVGEEDVIDLGAVRLVVGIVVKIVHVQIHGVVDIHLIGHFAVRG